MTDSFHVIVARQRRGRRRLKSTGRFASAADVLEVRQLLTDPPLPGIPSTAGEAFPAATSYATQAASIFDGRINTLFQEALNGTPYAMATDLRNANATFLSIAGQTPSGTPTVPGTFGTDLKSEFGTSRESFASQIEMLGSDFNTNSQRKVATLPTAFTPGDIVSMPGFPGFTYSTPFFVLGADGWAGVTSTSVSLNAKKAWSNPLAAPGAVDLYSQEIRWQDSSTAPGFIEGGALRKKSSPDGLAEISYAFRFNKPENEPLKLEGVFSQRDGAWIRSASFKMDGDAVAVEDASLTYSNGDTNINFKYHDHATGQKYWQGHASQMTDLFDRPFKAVVGAQRLENGDNSGYVAEGMKLGNSWAVVGLGHQELDGQETQNLGYVGYFLEHDFGPFGGVGASVSRSVGTPWAGATPSFLENYVTTDEPTLFLNVQQLGDDYRVTVELDVLRGLNP